MSFAGDLRSPTLRLLGVLPRPAGGDTRCGVRPAARGLPRLPLDGADFAPLLLLLVAVRAGAGAGDTHAPPPDVDDGEPSTVC